MELFQYVYNLQHKLSVAFKRKKFFLQFFPRYNFGLIYQQQYVTFCFRHVGNIFLNKKLYKQDCVLFFFQNKHFELCFLVEIHEI